MDFLGIGYQEILLVLVLTLIGVGPERLPAVAYQIGRAVRELQKYARAVRDEFSEEFEYVEEQYKVLKGEVDETRQALRAQQAELNAELRQVDASVNEAVNSAEAPPEPPRPAEPDKPPLIF